VSLRHGSGDVEDSASQARLDSTRARMHPHCVFCDTSNPLGLKLQFEVQPDGSVLATFPCPDAAQSYPGTLHGGVISALLDAAMTNVLFSVGVVAVTAELNVRFLSPVRLGRAVDVRASIVRATSRSLYYLDSRLVQGGQVVARGSAKFLARSS
jgi:uncharacterized protein (TIGR00369 family)